MFISRELDYAFRIIRALARQGDCVVVSQMCADEALPQPYSYKILKKLERASMVKAYPGVNGGYQLIASPQALTIYDVYRAIEGNLCINKCMKDEYSCANMQHNNRCAIHNELILIQDDIINAMKQHTLAEILNKG